MKDRAGGSSARGLHTDVVDRSRRLRAHSAVFARWRPLIFGHVRHNREFFRNIRQNIEDKSQF